MTDVGGVIKTVGLGKSYAGVEVLQDINLALRPGEIHALLGENGAGKSTFVRMLAGVVQPNTGQIYVANAPVTIADPRHAQAMGIALIHQEPVSFPDLSVAENLAIGRPGQRMLHRVPWRRLNADARRMMTELNAEIDVARPMRGLSIADQQLVEIARAISEEAQLIIMDEPTAALTPQEVDALFGVARRLRDEGRTVLFISHRLGEIRALCDRATVFRDGRLVATREMPSLDDAEIIELMIGRSLSDYFHSRTHEVGDVVLEVKALSAAGRFHDISFSLRRGQVVGLAGLVGAGRTDVANAIFGLNPPDAGEISIEGEPAAILHPRDAIAQGIGFVPEDRAVAGVFATLPVKVNITAAAPAVIAPKGVINREAEKIIAADRIAEFDIRCASMDQPIGELSGGNQQKAILARWLLNTPRILIVDEPTRGIDIGVRSEFYDMIGRLAAQGCAILLISSDLPELLALSDVIHVMTEGRMTATFDRSEATQDRIMRAAVPTTTRAAA